MSKERRSDTWILVIGIFKLVKAAVLVLVATGALELIHHSATRPVMHAARLFHVDPDGHLVGWIVGHLVSLSPHRLTLIAAGTFAYAGLFVLEGVGLVARKRWGEIVTVAITGSFIPWEIYEAVERATPVRFALIAVNVAIVVYLVWRLRQDR